MSTPEEMDAFIEVLLDAMTKPLTPEPVRLDAAEYVLRCLSIEEVD